MLVAVVVGGGRFVDVVAPVYMDRIGTRVSKLDFFRKSLSILAAGLILLVFFRKSPSVKHEAPATTQGAMVHSFFCAFFTAQQVLTARTSGVC